MSTLAQRSFSGGEIAPALYARVDIQKYATGLRTCRNFFIMRHGGAANRGGTEFVGEVKDSTKAVKLVPFIFNNSQTYALEFGNLYMRVIRDGAHVLQAATTITGITAANPAVVTSVAHGYATGDELYISGIVGMTQLNGRNLKITVLNANTYSLQYLNGTNVNSTAFTAYSSGGTAERVYTIATPYLEADLPDLQYVQSADVMTLVHPTYEPRDLARTGHASWTLTAITFAPTQTFPTGLSAAQQGVTGSTAITYAVTAVNDETGEESLGSATIAIANGNAVQSSVNYVAISWSLVSGVTYYNIYKRVDGVDAYIGTARGNGFSDIGLEPDKSDSPPNARNPFSAAGLYPATVTYFQQRLMFAGADNDPERVHGSRIGQFKNFTTSFPLQDDDAVNFSMAGRQVNSVRYLIDLGKLIIFTAAGEWAVEGDSSGILRPGEVNPKQYSYNGSAPGLPPIIIGNTALYVQARGSIVRDLGFSFESDGYTGNDLTIYSAHLFDNYTLVDWAYQQIPHSILWAVRDDGTLLGLTYVRDQQLLAWHRHDFGDGIAENVCVIPEGNEDVLYVVVRRTIDGVSKRYIERLSSRQVNDVKDVTILDSFLSYDGRNTTVGRTMTLSGSGWLYTDTLTLTCSSSFFTAADVGNQIHLYNAAGDVIRFTINAYTSATVVTGKPHKTVPVTLQATATATWTRAVDQLAGLYHLEGQSVSVFGDGFVVANPNNDAYTVRTVTAGVLDLDKPYGVIHVGLPITADLETLNIDDPKGETIVDKKQIVNKVTIFVEESRGAWIGGAPPPDEDTDFLGGLTETKLRYNESYNDPVALTTGVMEVNIESHWNSNGRIFIRQTDPIPLSVLAVAPAGRFPFSG